MLEKGRGERSRKGARKQKVEGEREENSKRGAKKGRKKVKKILAGGE